VQGGGKQKGQGLPIHLVRKPPALCRRLDLMALLWQGVYIVK
jgi:hypothetical protein